MSLQAITWAFEQQGLEPGKKLLLVALADSANHDHVCWPSIRRLRQMTCLARSTILQHLAALEADGIIERTPRFREGGGGQTSTSYRIVALEQRELELHPGPVSGPPRPDSGPPPSRSRTPPRPESGPHDPSEGTGKGATLSSAVRASKLATWLGEEGREALELFQQQTGASDVTLIALHGLYGDSGTDQRAWGSLAREKRPQAMANALTRYAAEATEYNGRFFRRFVEAAATDAQREHEDERPTRDDGRRARRPIPRKDRPAARSAFDDLAVDTGT